MTERGKIMGKVIEEKLKKHFRKASFGERERRTTCGDCVNMKMIDFHGMKQPRCGFFGDGIAKKYMISVKDTCDSFESVEQKNFTTEFTETTEGISGKEPKQDVPKEEVQERAAPRVGNEGKGE